jgi:hypothetical protein
MVVYQVVAHGQQQLHAQAVDAEFVIEVADFELLGTDQLQVERGRGWHAADAPLVDDCQP